MKRSRKTSARQTHPKAGLVLDAGSASTSSWFFKAETKSTPGDCAVDTNILGDVLLDWDCSVVSGSSVAAGAGKPSDQDKARTQQSQRQFEATIYGGWRSMPRDTEASKAAGHNDDEQVVFSGADLLSAASDRSLDVYGVHLQTMLRRCKRVHTISAAFDVCEHALMDSLLELPCASLALLHRLHSRKAVWFTLTDITKRYFEQAPQTNGQSDSATALTPIETAAAALAPLVSCGTLLPLPHSDDAAAAAVRVSAAQASSAAEAAEREEGGVLSTVFEGLPEGLVAVLQFLCTSASRLVLNGVAAKVGVRAGASAAAAGRRRLATQSRSANTTSPAAKVQSVHGWKGGEVSTATLVGKLALGWTAVPATAGAADNDAAADPQATDARARDDDFGEDEEGGQFLSVDTLDAAAAAAGVGTDNKAALIRQLVTAVMAQRTVFGRFLPVVSATHATLLALLGKSTVDSSALGGDVAAPLAVRLAPRLQLLLAKAHRVFYITTVQQSYTDSALAWSSSWDGDGGAAAWARCSNSVTSVFVRSVKSASTVAGTGQATTPTGTPQGSLASLIASANAPLCDARVDAPPHLGLLAGKLLRRAVGAAPSAAVSPPPSAASWRSVPPARVLALLQALGSSSIAAHTMADGSGGFAPGLLHVFHKMDFVPYTCCVRERLFGSPAHFQIMEACERLSSDHIIARVISKPVHLEPVQRGLAHDTSAEAGLNSSGYTEEADGTLVLSDSDEDLTEAHEGLDDAQDADDVLASTTHTLPAHTCGRAFGAHFAAALWPMLTGQESHGCTHSNDAVRSAVYLLFACPTPYHSPGLELLHLIAEACTQVPQLKSASGGAAHTTEASINMPALDAEVCSEMKDLMQQALVLPNLLFVVRLSTCLHLYSAWRLATSQPGEWLRNILCSSTTPTDFAEHSHLFLLEPQQKMAYILWEALDSLNRTGHHARTIPFLRQLVAIPFVRHRNGRVWARITINLAHIGLKADAALAAWEGLQDAAVVGGDRVYLQRKWRKQRDQLHTLDMPIKDAASSNDCGPQNACAFGCNADAAMLPTWVTTVLTAPQEPIKNKLLVNDRKTEMRDDRAIAAVEFEHRPLNRTVGEKSRFLGFDAENDDAGEDASSTQEGAAGTAHANKCGNSSSGLAAPQCCRSWLPAFVARDAGDMQLDGLFVASHGDIQLDGNDDKLCAQAGVSTALLYRMIVAEAQWEHSVVPAVLAAPPAADGAQSLDELFRVWPVLRAKGGAAVLQGIAMHTSASGGRPSSWKPAAPPAPSAGATADTADPAGAASAQPDFVAFAPHLQPHGKWDAHLGQIAALPLTLASAPWDCGLPQWSAKLHRERQMGVSVEHLCIGEYAKAGGWVGMHVEGGPLMMLAALFCFEVVFSLRWDGATQRYAPTTAIPDVFLTPYQDSPLDMTAGSIFAERRRPAIEALLRKLKACSAWELATWLAVTYCHVYGYQIRNVSWKRYPLSLLQLVAIGIGGEGLAAFCACYLSDPSHFTAGLPDLLLWRATIEGTLAQPLPLVQATENSTVPVERLDAPLGQARSVFRPGGWELDTGGGANTAPAWPSELPLFCPPCIWELLPHPLHAVRVDVCLSEVKGPRDTLSDKQRTWMSALAAGGCDVHLCKVKEPALHKPRGKRGRQAAARK